MAPRDSEEVPDGPGRSFGPKVVRGGVVLVARQAISFVLSFGSGVILARVLNPEDFGVYAVILFVVAISNVLADGGLSAALIRSQTTPTRNEYSMVFTSQMIVASLLAGTLLVASPLAPLIYGDIEGFQATIMMSAGAVLVGPVTAIGIAKLSRALRFGAVGMLQLLQGASLSIIVSVAALAGLGVESFGYSILISSVCMAIGVTLVAGRPPGLTIRLAPLLGWLRFSLPYGAAGFVSALKDAVNPVYIGIAVGVAASGYVKWAQQTSVLGVYLVTAVAPLLYASFSRLQGNRARLTRAVDTGLFWANALTAPITLILVVYISEITDFIYGEKWTAAIPLFLWLSISCLITPTTTVAMALLNSAGRSGTTLIFTLLWLVGSWALIPLLVPIYGFLAYGIANAVVQVFGIALIHITSRLVDVRWYLTLATPWAMALLAAVPAIVTKLIWGSGISIGWAAAGSAVLLSLFVCFLRIATPRRWHEILEMMRRGK